MTRTVGRAARMLICAYGLGACGHVPPLPAKAIALNRDGAASLAAGDLTRAEARIALALEYSPRFTEAWVNLGLIEMKRGNFERARSDLVRARDLNPDLSTPHHGLGVLSETVGSVADAERHYRAALKVDPGFAPARINLGRLLYQRGATEEAREQFARLTEVAPEYPEGWTGLCETLLRLDRTSEAQAVLETARSRFGSSPPIELLAARLLLRKSAFSEAATHLERVTREADRRQVAAAFAWLAVARLCEGKGDAAAAAADRAAALNPDDAVARYALLAAHRVANR